MSREVEKLTEALRSIVKNAGSLTQTIASDTEVGYHEETNRKIILPGNPEQMSLENASARLMALAAFNSQMFAVHEQIDGMPLDAAYAFVQVLRERYGWAETKSATKHGMFGPFKTKPDMHRVRTGPKPEDYIEVPVGDFQLPDINATITAGFECSSKNRNMSAYYLETEVKHSDRKLVMDLISATQRYLEQNSIYRGKAMRLRVGDDGSIDSLFEPEFSDYSKIDRKALVHPRDTERLLETGLFTPIRRVDQCRKHKVPLKRTVLLSGPYGTGKTLTAGVTAQLGLEYGWTFISVDNAKGLVHALEFAKRYQPAIIFAEDIDRVTEGRDEKANDLLNIIDGILGKGSVEVITVLTTNHIEKIHQAMLRPGRIDLIVPIGLPDAEAGQRLIRNYAGDLLNKAVNLDAVSEMVSGFIPAMIREVVESAKLAMITDGRKFLSADDLETSALGKKVHAELLSPKESSLSDEENFGRAARRLLNGHGEKIDEVHTFCQKFDQKYCS